MEQRQSAAGDHLAERPAIGQDGVGQELALATGRTAIVTDSTADLAPEAAAAVGVRVVPLFVRFGVEESRVGVDLSTEQFCTPMLRCLGGLR